MRPIRRTPVALETQIPAQPFRAQPLTETNLDPKEKLNKSIISAANRGVLTEVMKKITEGANPRWKNNVGMSAIDYARAYEYYKVVEFLENTIRNLDANLVEAVGSRDGKKVEELLDNGADPNVKVREMPVLIYAIGYCMGGIAELLVNKGADVNRTNNNEQTPLMMAVMVNDLRMVKFLVENEADVKYENKRGVSAISLAIAQGHTSIVNYLEKQ